MLRTQMLLKRNAKSYFLGLSRPVCASFQHMPSFFQLVHMYRRFVDIYDAFDELLSDSGIKFLAVFGTVTECRARQRQNRWRLFVAKNPGGKDARKRMINATKVNGRGQ